jgi:hypothetical protein
VVGVCSVLSIALGLFFSSSTPTPATGGDPSLTLSLSVVFLVLGGLALVLAALHWWAGRQYSAAVARERSSRPLGGHLQVEGGGKQEGGARGGGGEGWYYQGGEVVASAVPVTTDAGGAAWAAAPLAASAPPLPMSKMQAMGIN